MTIDHDDGERCERCGFAAADWNDQDTANTLGLGAVLRAHWAEGVPDAAIVPPELLTGPIVEPDRYSLAAVHEMWHDLLDIADARVAAGDRVPGQRGVVVGVQASGGGVPKRAVDTAEIGWRGLVADRQRTRQHHGRPWQALCLWSADAIDALVAEGNPIFPGAAGENLTIRGLDWGRLRAGALLDIGAVRCRLSAAAQPCTKNNRWFADGDSRRIEHHRHPGWSRWYASVLRPGPVAVGDAVVVS